MPLTPLLKERGTESLFRALHPSPSGEGPGVRWRKAWSKVFQAYTTKDIYIQIHEFLHNYFDIAAILINLKVKGTY